MTIRSWSDDPRAIQLRRRLETVLRALAREASPDTITIDAVCERADLGRHTFFQVFDSLDEACQALQPNTI